MSIEDLKQHLDENFSSTTWNRIQMQLSADLVGYSDDNPVNKEVLSRVHQTLESMYGSGLSQEVLNG